MSAAKKLKSLWDKIKSTPVSGSYTPSKGAVRLPPPPKPPIVVDSERIFAELPLGSGLVYCGVAMTVIHHQHWIPTYYSCVGPHLPGQSPAVIFRYADKQGVLRNVELGMTELRTLLGKLKEPRK